MLLSNELCNVQISIDNTYIVESADNKAYDIEINPHNMKHNDFYKVFAIEVDTFDKQIHIALVGECYSYETDCALLDGNILTVLSNNIIVQIDVVASKMVLLKEINCVGCDDYRYNHSYWRT